MATMDFLTPSENAELAASQETANALYPRPTPEGARAWIALMLSPTPDIWEGLLMGEPVRTDQLDQEWLAILRQRKIVE